MTHEEINEAERALLYYCSQSRELLTRVKPDFFPNPKRRAVFEALVSAGEGEDLQRVFFRAGKDNGFTAFELVDVHHDIYPVLAEEIIRGAFVESAISYALRDLGEMESPYHALTALMTETQRIYETVYQEAPPPSRHETFKTTMTTGTHFYKTGIAEIDRQIAGFEGGYFVLIGARPGTGKSSLGTTLSLNMAMAGIGNDLHQYEMTQDQTTRYYVSRMSLMHEPAVSIERMRAMAAREVRYEEQEMNHVLGLSEHLNSYDIGIHSCAGMDIRRLWEKIERSNRPVHIIDHMLRIPAQGKFGTQEERLAFIGRGTNTVSKKTGKCIIGLMQLNRASETANRAPILSDMRGTGAWEEEADVVMMLHESIEDQSGLPPGISSVQVHFHKVREGSVGKRNVHVNRPFAFFHDPPDPRMPNVQWGTQDPF